MSMYQTPISIVAAFSIIAIAAQEADRGPSLNELPSLVLKNFIAFSD